MHNSIPNFVRTPDSSNVAGFGYNPREKMLTVEFKGVPHNSVYDYFDVPETVFQDMKAADSKGTFLSKNIKGYFRYDRRRTTNGSKI